MKRLLNSVRLLSLSMLVGLLGTSSEAFAQKAEDPALLAFTSADKNIPCQPICPEGLVSNNPDLTYDPEDQSCNPETRGTAPNILICVVVRDEDGEKDGEACCLPGKKTQGLSY